jgi:hypothetical protein
MQEGAGIAAVASDPEKAREMGRTLIILGGVLLLAGLLYAAVERFAGGRLPGDVSFGGKGWSVSAPIATSILVSVILTLVLNLILWLNNRR